MAATLQLTRDGFGIELRRGRFDAVLDGNTIGSIEWNQTIEIPIEAGRHTLQMRAGRYTSRPHTFDAADDQTVAFHLHGVLIWPMYLASLVKPDLAITVKPVASHR